MKKKTKVSEKKGVRAVRSADLHLECRLEHYKRRAQTRKPGRNRGAAANRLRPFSHVERLKRIESTQTVARKAKKRRLEKMFRQHNNEEVPTSDVPFMTFVAQSLEQ